VTTLGLEAAMGVTGPRPRKGFVARLQGAAGALRRSPRMLVGLIILAFFVLVALIGPVFIHHPNALGPEILGRPSAKYWLGTTQEGQNVLYQVIASAGPTLEVGFLAGGISTLLSLLIGVGGAFIGGISDEALNLFTNIILVIPVMPLVIVVSAYVQAKSLLPTILIIAFTGWAGTSRVLRSLTLSMRSRDYILASRVSGERTWRIVVVELLPNMTAFIVSGFIFTVIFAILAQAGLAFLGLGNTNLLSWGNMLYWAQADQALTSGAWWWFAPPGLCIALVGTGLSLVNFGLDEVLNPRLRSVRPTRRKPKDQPQGVSAT
jgi:peptide/nickel transport system permease protein